MSVELVSLAEAINSEHDAVCRSVRAGIEHARRAGDLLIQAKAGIDHGAWLPWLSAHCPALSNRAAQRYMRIAREWPRLEAAANTTHVSHLPVREALALLADPRTPNLIGSLDDEVDWPERTRAMDAAWDDLAAELEDFHQRLHAVTDLDTAADMLHEATAIEGRAITLAASTTRDLRRLEREWAKLSGLSLTDARALLADEQAMQEYLGLCRARIAELEATEAAS